MEHPSKILITEIAGERFHLHPFKALYWEAEHCLLIADLHLGKTAHFRKSGIPVPQGVADANWDRLISLLLDFGPQRVIFLGDLFHSNYNEACDELGVLIRQFHTISFELVIGNHDILDESYYRIHQLKLHQPPFTIGSFILTHYPMEIVPSGMYNLAGHVHPSVRLFGKARQTLRLPCFYFSEDHAILPAFGGFTGTATIKPEKSDRIFVILKEEVIAL